MKNGFCFLLLLFLLGAGSAHAGTRYWVAGSSANWNNTANWSSSSGGAGGSSVPSTNDTVFFDGNGTGDCAMNVNISVQRLYMMSGYSGTITQNSGFTIEMLVSWTTGGVPGWTQHAGTFVGGDENFTVNARFHLLGGTFNCPYNASKPVYSTFSGGFRYEGGTFNHNNGWINIGRGHTINILVGGGRLTVARFQVAMSSTGTPTYTITSGQVVEVTDSLRIAGGTVAQTINTGTIEAKGVIENTNTATGGGGSATILINGTGSQALPGTPAIGKGVYPGININKSSGTLTLSGAISCGGDWTYTTTGTLTTTGSTVAFYNTKTVTGTHTLNKVYLTGNASTTITVASGTTVTVSDSLNCTGTAAVTVNTGTLEAKGHVTVTNSSTGGGGNGVILINNTTSQTLTGSGTINTGKLPVVQIDKSSGTLTLASVISVKGGWDYDQGTLSLGSSKLFFCGTQTISGTHALNKVTFDGSTPTYTISSGTTLTVNDSLEISGTTAVTLNTGDIHAQGNIYLSNTATSGTGGTSTITINGTGSQSFAGNSTPSAARVCKIVINKASGTLTLYNTIMPMQDWTYTAGTLDAGTSTVVFAASKTITGSHALYNVTAGSGITLVVASGTTLTVNGTFIIAGGTATLINTGTIHAKGDISLTNTATSGGGTATVIANGTGTQTLTGSGVNGGEALPNFTIDKASGTLFLSSTISCAGHWIYTQGTVDPGTSVVALIGTFNVDAQGTSSTMSFYRVATFGSGTRTLTGNLDANNNLAISNGTTLSAGSYTINVGGNWLTSTSGTWNAESGTVIFDGSGYTRVSKTGGTETFNNVTLNRSFANSSLTCIGPIRISGALTMTKGKLKTTRTNYLELLDNATATGGHDSAYVHGPIRKTGNEAFTFQLGDTTLSSGAYHPLSMTAPSSATDQFEAEYEAAVQSSGSAFDADSLEVISTCEHWEFERRAGSSTVKPTLGWNTNNCIANGPAVMRVARWDGSEWISMGYAGSTGNSSKGTTSASIADGFAAVTELVLAQKRHQQYLIVSTMGIDTIIGADTVKYKVSGAQLSGTYKAGGRQVLAPRTPNSPSTDTVRLKFFLTNRLDTTIVRFTIDHYAEISEVKVTIDSLKNLDTALYDIHPDTVLVLLNGNSTTEEQYLPPVKVVLYEGLVMSPNGDSQYDTFVVQGTSGYSSYQLTIYDRDGVQVYQTTNPADAWDGLDGSSDPVLPGTYKYDIVVDGQTISGQFLLEY